MVYMSNASKAADNRQRTENADKEDSDLDATAVKFSGN